MVSSQTRIGPKPNRRRFHLKGLRTKTCFAPQDRLESQCPSSPVHSKRSAACVIQKDSHARDTDTHLKHRRVGLRKYNSVTTNLPGASSSQLFPAPSHVRRRRARPRRRAMLPTHLRDSLLYVAALLSLTAAQNISTSTPVPPLQWIELTHLLSGSPPPPLKDASIGFDGDQTLLIFGGESAGGVSQSQTFLYALYLTRSVRKCN